VLTHRCSGLAPLAGQHRLYQDNSLFWLNMIRMKSILVQCQIITVILGCLIFSSLHAQEQWKFSVNQYNLRETFIDQQAVVLGVPCSSRLKFMCTQDQKGVTGCLSMEFTIAPCSKIAGFDFDAIAMILDCFRAVLFFFGNINSFKVIYFGLFFNGVHGIVNIL
jgi:hypothetical protein